jgi:hypothetical protein
VTERLGQKIQYIPETHKISPSKNQFDESAYDSTKRKLMGFVIPTR